MTAGANVVKMKKLENDDYNGSEIASEEEAHTEEPVSQEELKVQELGRIDPIDEGPPDVVVPPHPQAGANEPPQERRGSLQTLTWTNRKTYNIDGSCSAYQLAGGTFIKMSKEGNMLILQLPTSRAPVYQAITHCNLNAKICGYASDASQNLLVLSGCDYRSAWITMYSPTSSRPAPHPEATRQNLHVRPGFHTHMGYPDDPYDYTVKIAGDLVGMLIYSPGKLLSRLLVWNWKIGTLVGDTLGPQDSSFITACEFSFVSPTLFHVTTPASRGVGSIDLYSINPRSSHIRTGFTHLASLLLPPVKCGVTIVSVKCTIASLQASGSPNPSGSSQLSVLQIKYATHCGLFDSEQFQLVVPTSVFIEYWKESQSGKFELPITAQWDVWGPSETRWIPRPTFPPSPNPWTRHLRGQRVLSLPAEGPGIEVLDFDFDPNSPPVNLDPSLQQTICIDPTVIQAGDVFEKDVVSSLPYIKTSRPGALDEDFAGYIIDEEQIIAISVEGSGSDERISKLTTLTF
ncbi:hypothetical protein EST38_g5816 [Candolleomyces aberdarensis]|uniref:Uncharacterized protein n=1 Tax=Candolleomyces aberdarensis TaxID=2316362 RepID=A0A4Q2DJI9_9AGAR|nr:hypothetical protein EST38_g5816 [Candolleomyces aberdarensis]